MFDAFHRDIRLSAVYRRGILRALGSCPCPHTGRSDHYPFSGFSKEGILISESDWQWLETLPRTTLQNRVDYWQARDSLLYPRAVRVPPYTPRERPMRDIWTEIIDTRGGRCRKHDVRLTRSVEVTDVAVIVRYTCMSTINSECRKSDWTVPLVGKGVTV
jgi:hypothetical protein